ncbi:MAG: AI-2E family transporter [Deltaproteobacteria bacterium]|nr:AI-2E family transporter [Deltaproteobacteria bacterium]
MDSKRISKISFLMLLLLLMAAFAVIIRPFLVPAIVALIITVICWPVNRLCMRVFRGRRYAAAALATLLVSLCILGPLSAVITVAAMNAVGAVKAVVSHLEAGAIAQVIDQANIWIQGKMVAFPQFVPAELNIRAKLLEFVAAAGKVAYEYSPKVFTATAGFFTGILLVLLFLLMFFAEGDRLQQVLLSLVPLDPAHKQILTKEISGVITGTFAGMIVTALTQGLLIGIGYWIAGIDNAFVWGVVAVGVTLIPVIGALAMYLPPAAALFLGGSMGMGVFLLVWGLALVSMADNVIKPVVMRGKVNVHPVLLAIAIIGGSLWLGAIGFIIGPVIVAMMLAMLRIYRREFIA